jgi:hypothetical protein
MLFVFRKSCDRNDQFDWIYRLLSSRQQNSEIFIALFSFPHNLESQFLGVQQTTHHHKTKIEIDFCLYANFCNCRFQGMPKINRFFLLSLASRSVSRDSASRWSS